MTIAQRRPAAPVICALPTVTIDAPPVNLAGLPRTYMTPVELAALAALVRSVNARGVMEIGCNSGRTAALLLRECPTIEHYLGVDVLPGYNFANKVQRLEVPDDPGIWASGDDRFTLWLSKRGSRDMVGDCMGGDHDVVFIDGDHSEAAVEWDTALARRIVQPGGLIIWHDYHNLETVDVRRVLDAQYAEGRKIQHVAGTWLAFERVE
jgi:predicted O-methyltransferase YrrM